MGFYVPQYIRTLVPYVPGKPIEETRREYKIKEVIKLASNENPNGFSRKVEKTIHSHLKQMHRYPDGGAFRLKKAIADRLNVDVSSLILGNGSNEVIDLLVRTFSIPGDQIVTAQSAFIAYKICAQVNGVTTLEVPLDQELNFHIDEMLSTVRKNEKVRLVFIANPNNPTGTALSSGDLKDLLNGLLKVRDGSVIVVLDSAYSEYCTRSDLANPVALLHDYPNLVVLKTFSKVYGLAGLRLGYGIASSQIIGDLAKARQPFNINSLALAAGETALSDQAFVIKGRRANEKGMLYWEKQLEQMGIPFWKSQGNFILLDVLKGLRMTGKEVQEACLKKGVIFRPVNEYGLPHCLRVTIGTPKENLAGAQVLKHWVKERK